MAAIEMTNPILQEVCPTGKKYKSIKAVLKHAREWLGEPENWTQGALCEIPEAVEHWDATIGDSTYDVPDNAHCEFCLLGPVEKYYDHEGVEDYHDEYHNPVAAALNATADELYPGKGEAFQINDGSAHRTPHGAYKATLQIIDETIERLP